jgi:hypothetical protein
LSDKKKWQAPEFPGSDLSAPASDHKEDSEIKNTLFAVPNESSFFCNSKGAFLYQDAGFCNISAYALTSAGSAS